MAVDDAALLRADAAHIPLADESVDLVITSPPYFALRSYQDDGAHYDGQIGSEPTPADFLAALWAVTDELWRVLKPSGSCWINLGDKYAGSGGHNNAGISAGASRSSTLTGGKRKLWELDEMAQATRRNAPDRYNQSTDVPTKSLMGLPWRYALGLTCPDTYRPGGGPQWTLRAEVIWSKPNGLPESVTDRVRRSHEQWFHLTKQGQYFAAVDEVREAQVAPPRSGPSTQRQNNWVDFAGAERFHNPLGKLPGSVWTIPSEPLVIPDDIGVDHFAAFPQEWPRRIILGWSPPPNATTRPAVVLDPFVGTGTVPMVARALGRYGVGLDLSRDYLRLARWRITSPTAHKAINRTNRERQGAMW